MKLKLLLASERAQSIQNSRYVKEKPKKKNIKSGYNDPSKSTSWKVLKAVSSHLENHSIF